MCSISYFLFHVPSSFICNCECVFDANGLTVASPQCHALAWQGFRPFVLPSFLRPFARHLRVLRSASELSSAKDWLKDGRCGDTLAGGLPWTRCPRRHGASSRWPVSSLVWLFDCDVMYFCCCRVLYVCHVCLVAGSWGLTIGHSSSLPPDKREYTAFTTFVRVSSSIGIRRS